MSPLIKGFLGLALAQSLTFAQYQPPSVISALLSTYRSYSNLTSAATNAETYAVNITTWQMSHGGFSKANETNYSSPWNGSAALSSWFSGTTPLGMFDNNATVSEVRFLANQYNVSTNTINKAKFKVAVGKAIGFILTSQHASGSWPQVYPARTGTSYSNLATYNDNAMVRVMLLVKDIVDATAPFNTDIVSTTDKAKLATALTKSVDFAVKAQIVNGTTRTVWCQQHDPVTYAPAGARAYELPCKTASESVGVTAFLMNWPNQTVAIQAAVRGAVQWYTTTRVTNMKWVAPNFVVTAGASMWYRFYNVEDNKYFFCDRDGVKVFDITLVSMERRTGYQWGGDYASKLLTAAALYNPPGVGTSSSLAASSSSAKVNSSSVGTSSSVAISSSGAGIATLIKHGVGASAQTLATGDSVVGFWYSWENAPGISVAGVVPGLRVVVDSTAKSVTFSGIITAPAGTYTLTLTTVGGASVVTKSIIITMISGPVIIDKFRQESNHPKVFPGVTVDAKGRIRWMNYGVHSPSMPLRNY